MPELTIDYAPNGKAGTLTARFGDDVLALDSFDVRKSTARERFTKKLCDGRPGIDRDLVERELLKLAARESTTKPEPDVGGELDTLDVVRPELFHSTDVSGACVVCVRTSVHGPKGEWALYLRWHADGRRERRELCDSLDVPGGGRLWIWPTPGEPMPTQRPGWSASSRAAWLRGAAAPEPCDVFRRLCQLTAHYIDFGAEDGPGATAALALWMMLSYIFPAWNCVPYISVGGPLGSGKTTLFRVIARLCFRPLESSNLTAPALFRTLHELGGVLLLDEAERLRDGSPEAGELRSILLSGYKRGSPAIRLEKSGDGFKRMEFDVYGPKALAAIATLPEALASRCIRLVMFRAEPGSPKPRRRLDEKKSEFAQLRDDLHVLSLEHGPTWLRLANDVGACPAELSGRDFELWQPLFALAGWLERSGATGLRSVLKKFALEAVGDGADDAVSDSDELLLSILAEHVRPGLQKTLKAGAILEIARGRDAVTFARWTAKGAANALRRYGLKTKKGRGSAGRTYAHVTEEALARIQKTYGFELGVSDVETRTERTDSPP